VSLSPSNSAGCPPGRFLVGAALTLTASPAAGWGFAGWAGTLTSSAAVWSYTMGSAAAVQTAQFGQCFPLTLTATGPAGSAASASPPNSDGCVAGSYASGAALSLSATVPVGSTFLQWSGSGASGVSSSLTYIMPAAAATVTAELVVAPCYSVLTSVLTPDGTVSLSPSNSPGCAPGSFYAGTAVNVTAVPSNNYLFLQWGGGERHRFGDLLDGDGERVNRSVLRAARLRVWPAGLHHDRGQLRRGSGSRPEQSEGISGQQRR